MALGTHWWHIRKKGINHSGGMAWLRADTQGVRLENKVTVLKSILQSWAICAHS